MARIASTVLGTTCLLSFVQALRGSEVGAAVSVLCAVLLCVLEETRR